MLERLPAGAGVLIQKPMGSDLDEATKILQVCRERKLRAAVNFQLRFSPMMLAVRDALDRGLFGRLLDVEVRVSIDTPWGLFAFLKELPRIEIAVHSIHYLDLIRAFLGDPDGVHAKTIGHPSSEMAQTRTAAILDYGDEVRSAMSVNHNHAFGRRHQVAEFRFEGSEGAAHAKMGVLLDYPRGEPDELTIKAKGEADWVPVSRCTAAGSPTPSSAAWRTCSASSPARTRNSSPRSRTPGRPWRWSRRRSNRAPGRRRRSETIRDFAAAAGLAPI